MKKIIILLFALLLFADCGTKTKTKSESESEIKVKTEAKEEDELRRIDSIMVSKIEEAKREFSQIAKENSVEEGNKRTTTEVTETYESPTKDFRQIDGNPDLYINDANGRLMTKITKTIIDEKFKAEKNKEIETKKIEQEKKTSDSIAELEVFSKKMKEAMQEVLANKKEAEKNTVQEGWQTGFWFWFWIVLIIILIIAYFVFRKWLLIQFPWLSFINKKNI